MISSFFRPLDPVLARAVPGIPQLALNAANSAVLKEQSVGREDRKRRGEYNVVSQNNKLEVAKYAAENGVSKAVRNFPLLNLAEQTVRSWRDKYLAEVRQAGSCDGAAFSTENRKAPTDSGAIASTAASSGGAGGPSTEYHFNLSLFEDSDSE